MDQKITILQNSHLIKQCKKVGIETPLIHSTIIILKQIDSGLKIVKLDIQTINFIKSLENGGFVDIQGDICLISSKGRNLLDIIAKEIVIEKIKKEDTVLVEEWVDDWLKLWKTSSNVFYKAPTEDGKGRSLGSTKLDVVNNFNTFIKVYGYIFKKEDDVKNIIFKTTERYINHLMETYFEYGMKSSYFIIKYDKYKKSKSKLADLIEDEQRIKESSKTKSLIKRGIY